MKRKVVSYFMLLTILTLTLVMVCFGIGMRRYFYQELANGVKNHTEAVPFVWAELGTFTGEDLKRKSNDIIKFYEMEGTNLLLLTRNGDPIQSTTGYLNDHRETIDSEVLSFETVYKVEKGTGQRVMVVYTPLFYHGQTVAVLKYETPLTETDQRIYTLLNWGFFVCLMVASVAFLVSLRLGNSIVLPLKNIILLTKRMAEGNYQEKIEESYPYEAGELVYMLNYMADEITKADRMKSDFISSISHELRTPLTGIKGWVETIKEPDGLTEEEMRFGLRIMEEETERLIRMVESLLDFSRYQSDRMVLDRSPIALDELVEKVSLGLIKKAEKKNIRLIRDLTPVRIEGDWDKLKQVVINVLDNGIKFSEKNSEIVITMTAPKDWVHLVIQDTGIGVKEEHLTYITHSFFKADKRSPGEGLGLAISQRIMALHGGSLSIESEYGKGTSVTMKLPLIKD
ncbi:sensor histidine kinase [Lacrimispora algidixylanolytica]|uniref:histidine kinase n=1 Tax=Lacrimispora algidixylanolytica TaxID=94868 RepID=A0A419TBU1_9FIRM|nr:HAMP domain-containing sensor histidine kinase [Lacrimispora algidixylanolytica]RKD34933.1 two-component sensor histidine kinase [Lacrimispora algidixylanolytica]